MVSRFYLCYHTLPGAAKDRLDQSTSHKHPGKLGHRLRVLRMRKTGFDHGRV
jgi:hypothetical protein